MQKYKNHNNYLIAYELNEHLVLDREPKCLVDEMAGIVIEVFIIVGRARNE